MFFNGTILIPLVALILLVVSFFAKVPGGVKFAADLFGLIVLQVIVLPMLSREVGSGFGALHGVNALVLMGVAIMAGQRAADDRREPLPADRARHRLRGGVPRPGAAVAGERRHGRARAAPGVVLAGQPAAGHLRHGGDGVRRLGRRAAGRARPRTGPRSPS